MLLKACVLGRFGFVPVPMLKLCIYKHWGKRTKESQKQVRIYYSCTIGSNITIVNVHQLGVDMI
jgi:hypothetical protein